MTKEMSLLWLLISLFMVYGSLKLLPFFDVVGSDDNSYLHCDVGAVLSSVEHTKGNKTDVAHVPYHLLKDNFN